jgi:hypothetical protein
MYWLYFWWFSGRCTDMSDSSIFLLLTRQQNSREGNSLVRYHYKLASKFWIKRNRLHRNKLQKYRFPGNWDQKRKNVKCLYVPNDKFQYTCWSYLDVVQLSQEQNMSFPSNGCYKAVHALKLVTVVWRSTIYKILLVVFKAFMNPRIFSSCVYNRYVQNRTAVLHHHQSINYYRRSKSIQGTNAISTPLHDELSPHYHLRIIICKNCNIYALLHFGFIYGLPSNTETAPYIK